MNDTIALSLPRWVHKVYAAVFRYFWLPCPLCGCYFGGHEWKDRNGLSSTYTNDGAHSRKAICPACTLAGKGDGEVVA